MSRRADDTSTAKREIRIIRQKEVADIAGAVLKDKTDMPEMETCLHRVLSRYNRTAFAEREVFGQILESQLFMSRVMRQMSEEMNAIRLENIAIKAELALIRTV